MDWETYCILPESQDDKLVDLVLRIGEPFPLLEETVTQCLSSRQSYKSNLSLTSASGREAPSARQGRRIASSTKSNSEVHNAAKDALLSSSANMLPEKQRMPEDEEIKEKPLIRSFLVVHEGVKSSYPYSIEPQQVILPARGYATLTISFMPSLKALAAYGKRQEAYALGFMTLDDSCTKVCTYVCVCVWLYVCVHCSVRIPVLYSVCVCVWLCVCIACCVCMHASVQYKSVYSETCLRQPPVGQF